MPLKKKNGHLLKKNGHLRKCCCPAGCCGGTFSTDHPTLYLHLSDVTDCPCIEGICVVLEWDPVDQLWKGYAEGEGCALFESEWHFLCTTNPDKPAGAASCFDFSLSIDFLGACQQINGEFPEDCDCAAPSWEFEMTMVGIGCCDGAMSGTGTVRGVVDTVAC